MRKNKHHNHDVKFIFRHPFVNAISMLFLHKQGNEYVLCQYSTHRRVGRYSFPHRLDESTICCTCVPRLCDNFRFQEFPVSSMVFTCCNLYYGNTTGEAPRSEFLILGCSKPAGPGKGRRTRRLVYSNDDQHEFLIYAHIQQRGSAL